MERKNILRVSAAGGMMNSISKEFYAGGVNKVYPLPFIMSGNRGLYFYTGLFACLDLVGE